MGRQPLAVLGVLASVVAAGVELVVRLRVGRAERPVAGLPAEREQTLVPRLVLVELVAPTLEGWAD